MGKTKITKNQLESLVLEDLTDREIAEKYAMTPIGIYTARKRFGLERSNLNMAKELPLTQEQKEFMIGCLLGDGSLRIDKNCINPRFTCEHSSKQKDYAYHKYAILNGLDPKIRKAYRKDKRTNKSYESFVVRLNANPALLKLYKSLYNPTKEISNECLKDYTERSLAIHYMDDGYISTSGYYVATQSFNDESLKIFKEFLKNRFNIESSIHKGNILYIKAESKELFTNLIKDHVIPCMRYKLHNI